MHIWTVVVHGQLKVQEFGREIWEELLKELELYMINHIKCIHKIFSLKAVLILFIIVENNPKYTWNLKAP